MRLPWTLFAFVLAALTAPAVTRGEALRQGVPVEAVAPPGMARVRVAPPMRPGLPVRLTYRGPDDAHVVVDVLVADSTRAAGAALARWQRQLTREPALVTGVGDAAYGGAALLGFVRVNVMVAVRRVGGAVDVAALAQTIDQAILAAPRGAPRPVRVTALLPEQPVRGRSAAIALSAPVLAADLKVKGPGFVRRGPDGWRLIRTGEGPLAVTVTAIDELLRVSR
jgi:hypothetical protein